MRRGGRCLIIRFMDGPLAEMIENIQLRRALPPPPERKRLRTEAGLSQAAAAGIVGAHRVVFCRWENGTRMPKGEHLRSYVRLLDAITDALNE